MASAASRSAVPEAGVSAASTIGALERRSPRKSGVGVAPGRQVVVAAVPAPEALHRRSCLDQRAVDREMLVRQQAGNPRGAQHRLKEARRDIAGNQEASSQLAGEMGKVEVVICSTGRLVRPGSVWRETFWTWNGLQSLVMSDTTHSSVLSW